MTRITAIQRLPVRLLILAPLLWFAGVGAGLQAAPLQSAWDHVTRVVVIADLHGDYEQFTDLLKESELVNRRLRWSGGNAHLVQLGDVVDRGADSRKIVDLLRRLEREAPRKGGRVHALIGNHEGMMMQGDTRYTHPGEYAAFVDRNSRARQERYYLGTVEYLKSTLPEEEWPLFDDAYRRQWQQQFPLGYVELRIAWAPDGEYGAWVLGHNAVIRIDDTLYLHGGLHPDYADAQLQELNERVRTELKRGESLGPEALVNSETGPLWYRGLASSEESCEAFRAVKAALEGQGVARIVIGHTPVAGAVLPRFDGKILVADAGISGYYRGSRAALLIEDGEVYALHQGTRISLATARARYLRELGQVQPVAPLFAEYLSRPESLVEPDLTCPPPPEPVVSPGSGPESPY